MAEQSFQTIPQGMIVDFITKELKRDSPEEYIRQNFEKALHLEYGYSLEEIGVEIPVKVGSGVKKRVDICVFAETGGGQKTQEFIRIIVETKKPAISHKDKNEGAEQLKSYLSSCVNAEFGIWTNGVERLCYRKVMKQGLYIYEEIVDIPKKNETIHDVYEITKKRLKKAVGDNLLFTFKRCHNYIAGNQGLDKKDAFWELLKMIFCKIFDERSDKVQFRIYEGEDASINGQLKVKKRVNAIFEEVKEKYSKIFKPQDQIELEPRVLCYVVSQLQLYDLLNSEVDVKGTAYEEIVGANLRGDRGEFFTPRNVIKMAITMLHLNPEEKFLDPACGTGGFLIYVFNGMKRKIEEREKRRWGGEEPTDMDKFELYRKIQEYADTNMCGIDFNPALVKASKMNMVMNNDGQGGLFSANSLENPNRWEDATRENVKLGQFDAIATNPPFGTNIKIDDPHILEQYELARRWKRDGNGWFMTDKYQSAVPPEILFIERCVQFLRPNGRMTIVLPNGILSDPKLEYVRHWIVKNCEIVSSVSLPVETFLPYTGTQTGVIMLRKKVPEEVARWDKDNYNVFFKVVDFVGKNRRGKTIYKLDEEGNELIKRFRKTVERKVGDVTEITHEEFEIKIVNDDTNAAAEIYLECTRGNLELMKKSMTNIEKVRKNSYRLDATFYDKKLAKEIELLKNSGFGLTELGKISSDIYDPPLFTRIYVTKEHGVPYMSSSEMLLINPPLDSRFISRAKTKNISSYIVKENDILITAAGTVGNVLFAPKYLEGAAVTSDVTRVKMKNRNEAAFISAFLSTRIGRSLMTKNIYGSIVDRIRAQHIENVPIPEVPHSVKERVSKLVIEAAELRNKAFENDKEAKRILEDLFNKRKG